MLTLGVDPDLHHTAFALVDQSAGLRSSYHLRVPAHLKGEDAVLVTLDRARDALREPWIVGAKVDGIAIEAQQHYVGSPVDPADLLMLAMVSGGIAALLQAMWPSIPMRLPRPCEWKGQVPKKIHHARVARILGSGFHMLPTEHCKDAAALALWLQK